MGAGGLRGLRAPAADRGRPAAPCDARPADADGGRTVDARRRRPPRPSAARRAAGASRCGAPRPTTTGSAGWPRAGRRLGVDRLERRLRRHRTRRGATTVVRSVRRDRGGIVVPHEAAYTALADGGIAVTETVDIPDDARRPRPGRHRPRGRARAGDAALVRHRAARDVPGPQARRARRPLGVDRHRPVRPVHPAAGERRSRRRPLAGARRAAGAGLRIDLDQPRQVSVTHLRAADLAAATHDVDVVPRRRDDRPPRCRPPRPRHRQLRPGHARPSTGSARAATAGPGPCATSRRT